MAPSTRRARSTVTAATGLPSPPLPAPPSNVEHVKAIAVHLSSPEPEASRSEVVLQLAVLRAPSPLPSHEAGSKESESDEHQPQIEKSVMRELPVPVSKASDKRATLVELSKLTGASAMTNPTTPSMATPVGGILLASKTGKGSNSCKRTLADAINKTRAWGEAICEHLCKNSILKEPLLTPSPTLNWSLVPLPSITGNALVDSIIDDMKALRYCLWLADSKKILKSCDWVKNTVSNSYTLIWKKDCPHRPAGSNGTALIGWMGQVSGELSSLTPDAGWTYTRTDYDEGFCKKKRFVAPPPIMVINSDQEDDESDKSEEWDAEEDEWEIPESHRYPTWSITLPRVKWLFEKLIDTGHQPQILNTRDCFDTLLHPNEVYSTLNGALAYVYVTLKKQLFNNPRLPNGKAWQFFANLVKVQALKAPSVPKPTAMKRKNVHGYNMTHAYQDASGGASSSKRVKL
ncbi:hypothetical protein FRC11_007913 [Ceratobasidium sp. 423]|nr:hypothetical protein FRC11_007913 [Ceratobasidium sp. 423]